jgi:NAD(P)-dependent dehydrogenase (short-subunit alcohol dehydrogenase family)
VRAFVREGAHVASLDFNDEVGTAAAAEIGDAVHFIHCDVTDKDLVDAAVDEAVAWLGGLDGVVDIAGNHIVAPASELTPEELDKTLRSHVHGTVYVNQAAFRHLRETGGRIINTGSGVAPLGQRRGSMGGDAHYAAAKGAIHAWTRGIAREWGPFGITANTVVPAAQTPMYRALRDSMTPEMLAVHNASMAMEIPIGGALGDPDTDFGPVVVFLASDMSRFVTGQVIAANGGLYMFG